MDTWDDGENLDNVIENCVNTKLACKEAQAKVNASIKCFVGARTQESMLGKNGQSGKAGGRKNIGGSSRISNLK